MSSSWKQWSPWFLTQNNWTALGWQLNPTPVKSTWTYVDNSEDVAARHGMSYTRNHMKCVLDVEWHELQFLFKVSRYYVCMRCDCDELWFLFQENERLYSQLTEVQHSLRSMRNQFTSDTQRLRSDLANTRWGRTLTCFHMYTVCILYMYSSCCRNEIHIHVCLDSCLNIYCCMVWG